jgi:excisionase family DNA binding protein
MNQSIYLRKKEVAQMLGISESTVYRWNKMGEIPSSFQLGPNRVVWDKLEIEQAILLKKQNTSFLDKLH